MKNLLTAFIRTYQKTISPDHGIGKNLKLFGCCKFYPTCSQYAVQALQKYSTPKALWLSAVRILRCNPLSKGGINEP